MPPTIVKIVAVVGMTILVAFSPAAHMLKHVLSAEPRYDGWLAREAVHGQIKPGDLLYFSNDQYLLPFLDLVSKKYKGQALVGTYWIFPYLVIGRDYEARTVTDFVCHVARHEESDIIWGVSKEYLSDFNKGTSGFIVNLGFWRQFKIDFTYSEILYEVYDGLFARGRIEQIRQIDEGAEDAGRIIYRRGTLPPECL